MASLQVISGHYHICFRFNGRRFKRSLKTSRPDHADARRVRLEETIRLVETGRLDIPDDVSDIARFLLADGKAAKSKSRRNGHATPPPQTLLKQVFDKFFAAIPAGNLEESTLKGMHRHEGHLLRLLGAKYPLRNLSIDKLQTYVNRRANEKTHYGTPVQPNTIHKELVTLGTVWRWAERSSLVSGTFPRRGVRLPKSNELPPFQTWEEIERQINLGGLTDAEISTLWDALYLRRAEIDELLAHVKEHARQPFIYPMIVMAAHTGARRAELLRSRRSDFDFDGAMVTIREKKRVHGRNTTRRVAMSPTLRAVMQQWIEHDHPGDAHTFRIGEPPSPPQSDNDPTGHPSPNPTADVVVAKDDLIGVLREENQFLRTTLESERARSDADKNLMRELHVLLKNMQDRLLPDATNNPLIDVPPEAQATPQPQAKQKKPGTRKPRAPSTKTRSIRKKSTVAKKPVPQRLKQTTPASPAKPKWYELPTLSRYLPRKK